MEPVVSGVAGATEDCGLGGCRRPPGRALVAWDIHGGGPNVEYPGPTFRGIEAGSTRSIMAIGGLGESVCRENMSGVMFILPGKWAAL